MSLDQLAPADLVAELLRRRGVEVDIDHLKARADDHRLADRERSKARRDSAVDHIRSLASVVWKARRATEAAMAIFKVEGTQETLREVTAARSARTAAEAELLDACLQDHSLYAAVLRECRQ
jgi:hypothetical protein